MPPRSVPEPGRAAVIRQGDRPRLNTALAGLLADAYPELEVDDIDVLGLVRSDRRRYLRAAASGVVEYTSPLLRRRTSVKRAIVSSAGYARAAGLLVRERVAPGTHRFTFQSQSLFSAAVPGVSNFVYTDHAHLANLGYPGFDRAALKSSAYLAREAELYAGAERVFTRSRHVADTIVHGYGCSSERVIVVGVGPNAVPPSDDAVERATESWYGGRIIFVGVDWERKGGPELVAAFRILRERFPEARLDIVGCSPAGVAGPGIEIHGRLPLDRVAELLAASDVFCLPTLAEPFGVVFIEAMHAGLPVVGTRLGAIPDFVIPHSTGALVAPGDVDELAHALAELLADPDRTRRMGRAARALAGGGGGGGGGGGAIRHHIDDALATRSEGDR